MGFAVRSEGRVVQRPGRKFAEPDAISGVDPMAKGLRSIANGAPDLSYMKLWTIA